MSTLSDIKLIRTDWIRVDVTRVHPVSRSGGRAYNPNTPYQLRTILGPMAFFFFSELAIR